ncbi:acyl carrier protein [Candidatus Omnitrophota bacterium]
MSEVEQKLAHIIAEVVEIEKNELLQKRDVNFFKELGVDSLLGLELVAAVEREFDIKIEDEEITDLDTFDAILNLTNKKLEVKK